MVQRRCVSAATPDKQLALAAAEAAPSSTLCTAFFGVCAPTAEFWSQTWCFGSVVLGWY